MSSDTDNLTQIAARFVNSTNRHIFLTGRAGTGKTTFLREIAQKTHKKAIIAAPTGIAAINAGGVTLHSLLQLPFGTFYPSNSIGDLQGITTQVNTPRSMMQKMRFNQNKRAMLREMELLIIDEVSMLRADLLDAMDTVLRSVRRQRDVPFGGVQILFIGDLLQLPPVIKDSEWRYLSSFYKSAYFFEALALQQNKPVYIELDKIYRQTEQEFIDILNRFRDNKPSRQDMDRLNKCYDRSYKSEVDNERIFITTHNRIADEKNSKALSLLKEKPYEYSAELSGEFPEHNYPVEQTLVLKKGARVMFIKNDSSGEHRYFNGKIGTVSSLDDDDIEVRFDDDSDPVSVERYFWENKRFKLNEQSREIEEKMLGTFSHYPIKLAWAVTVHKSQGLTFEKAVLDLENAFAPGQIYVALSRLRSLKGLVLAAPINIDVLQANQVVLDYAQNKSNPLQLNEFLNTDTHAFIEEEVLKAFDFDGLKKELEYHYYTYDKDQRKSEKQNHKSWARELIVKIEEPLEVATKFRTQVSRILHNKKQQDLNLLLQRIVAAKGYFEPKLKDFSRDILEHRKGLESVKKVKAYLTELDTLENHFFRQLYFIFKCEAIVKSAIEKTELFKEDFKKSKLYKDRETLDAEVGVSRKLAKKAKTDKKVRINTREITFQLFKSGKSIEEIALERSLTIGTIQGHFSPYLKEGLVKLEELIEGKKILAIKNAMDLVEEVTLSEVKREVGNDYTFGEVRMVMNALAMEKETEK